VSAGVRVAAGTFTLRLTSSTFYACSSLGGSLSSPRLFWVRSAAIYITAY